SLPHLSPRARQVPGALREPADDEHEALGAKDVRLLDRPAVVVEPSGLGEEAPAAKTADHEPVLVDARFRFREAQGGDLVPPGPDPAEAMPRAALDDLGEAPLLANRGAVQREPVGARRGQRHPCSASSSRMRRQASSGSASRPAASASRKSSAKWSTFLADCWPPTMTKCSWWPFSHAMKTTPVL